MKMKAIYFEATQLYLIKLPKGVYNIHGKPVTISQNTVECELTSIDNIFRTVTKNKTTGYTDGDKTITPEEFAKLTASLPDLADYSDKPAAYIDARAEVEKFQLKWTKVTEPETVSERLWFEVDEIKRSVTKWITHPYFGGGSVGSIFFYNRLGAMCAKAREILNKLGLTEVTGRFDTPKKGEYKVGNIRFLQTGNGYINICAAEPSNRVRGEFDKVNEMWKDDMAKVEEAIRSHYNLHSGATFDPKKFVKEIDNALFQAGRVDSKVKTQPEMSALRNTLALLKNMCTEELKS